VINHGLADFLGNSPSFSMAHDVAAGPAGEWHHVNPVMFGQTDVAPGSVETWSTEASEGAHTIHVMMMVLSTLGALAGIYLAYVFHLKDRTKAERLAASYGGVARVLEAKYWVDEVYQNGIVEPLRGLGRAFFAIDRFLVDGLVNTLGFAPQLSGLVLKLTTQRGYLQGYAVTMLFGIVVILLVVLRAAGVATGPLATSYWLLVGVWRATSSRTAAPLKGVGHAMAASEGRVVTSRQWQVASGS
jgi:hypothetical protein